MVFTIKENSIAGATLLQTTTTKLNNIAPEIFFTSNSFLTSPKPRWAENERVQGNGSISHYAGSSDDEISVEIFLYGTNRKTNLAIIKAFKSKFLYLDANDIDSNLTGVYYCSSISAIRYDERKQTIIIPMSWKKCNN